MLHETFARLAASNMSAYLRAPVTVDLISLEQVPYEEYLRSISQSVFTIMSLPPLTGQAVLEVEFGLVFTMIDRMLGGPGKAINRTVLEVGAYCGKSTILKAVAGLLRPTEGDVYTSAPATLLGVGAALNKALSGNRNITLGGPLIKDKVWFYGGFDYVKAETQVPFFKVNSKYWGRFGDFKLRQSQSESMASTRTG